MALSPDGEASRASIVELVRKREQAVGRDARIRNGFRAMLTTNGPVIDYLIGLDDEGWRVWIDLQDLIAGALKGAGGIDVIEAAADDLDILAN